nr:T9SS type A sorting domain-containing protein [candidate division Zixibacteria bacterium]
MRTIAFYFLIFACMSGIISAEAQETLYPDSFDISSRYAINAITLELDDTLIIKRTIVNHEAFSLTGLYFSENLPVEFKIVDQSVRKNGQEIDYIFSQAQYNHEIPDQNTFSWIIDSLGNGSGYSNPVNPGDSLELEIRITSQELGDYILPLHSTVFYGNSTGFFSTSNDIAIDFVLSLDVDDDGGENDLINAGYLLSNSYPNPFNSTVVIKYAGFSISHKQAIFEVFDILGRNIFRQNFTTMNNEGLLNWVPEESIGSGLYFYVMTIGEEKTRGKLLLLK